MSRFPLLLLLLAAASLMPSSQSPKACAEDFRVDNTAFSADEKGAVWESTTFFHEGVVYDLMKKPAETMVFDSAAGRFWLLNMAERTRAELTTDNVLASIEQLKPLAAKSREPLVQFLANPEFEERVDENLKELTLSSTLVKYAITMSYDATPEMVQQYRDFSDWSARLNMLLKPGSRPPFGRLKVNAALAERQAVPARVVLNTSSGKGMKPQKTSLRSEHRIVRPLTQEDLDRVAQVQDAVATFKLIDFEQYCKAEAKK